MRKILASNDKISAAVEGDIETVDQVLRITRIRVRYALTIPRGMVEVAQRVVEKHPTSCPAANSVRGCIELDIQAEITEE